MDYQTFLETKALLVPSVGLHIVDDEIHESLFPFQRALVIWAVGKGRAALFADTGLGKTRMQLEWARLIGERTLILAPLAVAQQTIREAEQIGIVVTYAKTQAEASDGITITNYERLANFDASTFGAVALDESSILKSYDGKTRTALIDAFRNTPYRLCCTATPAPNDIAELANHAEFLGILTRVEMLATFFVHDDDGWRLKGHAKQPFYRWLASWGMSVKQPSDLGFENDGYNLPALSIKPRFLPVDYTPPGQLFFTSLNGITDRGKVRKSTVAERVAAAVELVMAEPDEPWLLWTGLNDEAKQLTAAIANAVNVEGSQTPEVKATALLGFADGAITRLVTKPSVAGHGMNWQHCARMIFVGLGDSYEAYYQAIRRCWRFGQTRPVTAWVILTEPEEAIYHNVLRKERDAAEMSRELVAQVAAFERDELTQRRDRMLYEPTVPMELPTWLEAA